MGLFDGMNFQGDNGVQGLLARLMPALQQQYAPSSGFPQPITDSNGPSPFDNAQWPQGPMGAPPRAQSAGPQPHMVVGSLGNSIPVPTFGGPDPAQIPQNAQPAQYQQPPQQAQQPMQQPSSDPTFGDHLMNGFKGFIGNLNNGPIGALAGGLGGLVTGQRTDPGGIAQKAQNQTVDALAAKGIDRQVAQAAVGNPDLMKALIAQAFPASTAPAGFAADGKGGMNFIPGGPADPAYLRLKAAKEADPNAVHVLGQNGELYKVDENGNPTIVHKNQPSSDATLNDETTQAMADQYLAGDRTVLTNLGRGAQGAANVVKLRETIMQRAKDAGVDPQGIVDNFNEQAGKLSGQRAIGTRAANISLAANEANNMIPIAEAASKAVPRGNWMPINQAVQAVQKGTSSPELASFVAATNSLVNAYVRAVSPSGVPTDAMRQHAYDMLNAAQGHDAYMAVIKTMQKEMGAALTAPGQVRKELRSGGGEQPSTDAASPTSPPSAPAKQPPQVGVVIKGHRFKGGDPASPASWQKVDET
jgi:hypothetical protein